MASRASCFVLLAPALLCLLSSPCVATNILYSGSSLYTGQSLTYGAYYLIMQSDCNLVLYDSGRPVWATNTGGRGSNCRATMQKDGNFVVYNGNNNAVWASGSNGRVDNYVLILQHDRNVVVYGGSIWGSGSNAYGTGVTISGAPTAVKDDTSAPTSVVADGRTGRELGLGRKIDLVTNRT